MWKFVVFLIVCFFVNPGTLIAADSSKLLPIESFFEPAKITNVGLSPKGNYYTAIHRIDGELMLFITNLASNSEPVVGIPLGEGVVRWVRWASEDRLLISKRAGWGAYRSNGAVYFGPKYRTVAMDRNGDNIVTLFEGATYKVNKKLNLSRITDLLIDDPDHVLMPVQRGSKLDLWKVNIQTGEAKRVERGKKHTLKWITDSTGKPVIRIDANRNYSFFRIFALDPNSGNWRKIKTVEEYDRSEFWPQAASENPGMIYVVARPKEADKSGVYLYNVATDKLEKAIATSDRVDIEEAFTDPYTHEFLGSSYTEDRLVYKFINRKLSKHLRGLNKYFGNEANVRIISMDNRQNQLLLYVSGPTLEGGYYLYNVENTHVELIADIRPELAGQLSPMENVVWEGLDGVELSGYLTKPANSGSAKKLPLVVIPHGGPEIRDTYSYDLYGQFLASRGYLVFQPNFRGSGGFGRKFTESGHKQWGRAMQDDITVGVAHLIAKGEVDAQRVCIFGASYGGYAALAGASFTPDLYQCAVSIAGVSDLPNMLSFARKEYGGGSRAYEIWKQRIGDPKRDKKDIIRYSPALQAHRVKIPILLIHGEKDQIVKIEQSEKMHQALLDAGKQSQFTRLEKAGHSNWSWLDEAKTMREIELFLAKYLKGKVGSAPNEKLLERWDDNEFGKPDQEESSDNNQVQPADENDPDIVED